VAKEVGFEGIVAKRKTSFYEPGKRSGAWLKYRIQAERIWNWVCYLADIHLSYMSREMLPALKFHLNLLRIPRIHLVGVFIA